MARSSTHWADRYAAEARAVDQGGQAMNFYEQFLVELDKVEIRATDPAASVTGVCIRAAKRAQMVLDGEHVADVIPRLDTPNELPLEWDAQTGGDVPR